MVDGVEPAIEHGSLRGLVARRGQSVVLLALVLEREQDLVAERAGPSHKVAIAGIELQIHERLSEG